MGSDSRIDPGPSRAPRRTPRGQALGLLRAATLSGDPSLERIVERVLRTHAFVLERVPHAFPVLTRTAALAEHGLTVAVIVGLAEDDGTRVLAAAARRLLGPEDAVIVYAPGRAPRGVDASWLEGRGPVQGRAAAYVCRGVTCSLPVTDAQALQTALSSSWGSGNGPS